MLFAIGSSVASPIVKSLNGVDSIGWTEGGCAWEVSSSGPANLKISVQSEACDPASPDVQPQLTQYAAQVMGRRVGPQGLSIDLYLPHSPALLMRWGVILKSADEWESRRRSPQAQVISDNDFFSKLMDQGQLFRVYEPLFKKLGGRYESVTIDKVVYPPAGDFSFYETGLEPKGFSKDEPFPVSLVTRIKIVRR